MGDRSQKGEFGVRTHTVRDVARQPTTSPSPEPPGRPDRVLYRAVSFYGVALSGPLGAAADYLRRWEDAHGSAPHVLCLHDEFSFEDEGTELAWKVTLVLGEPDGEPARQERVESPPHV
jgi:hypothetical protein